MGGHCSLLPKPPVVFGFFAGNSAGPSADCRVASVACKMQHTHSLELTCRAMCKSEGENLKLVSPEE